jgi:hypothetical protein
LGDNHVAGVFALCNATEMEPTRKFGWHVFERMHREVGAPLDERLFDLLDENALATNFAQSAILNAIPGGGDVQFLDIDALLLAEELHPGSSLSER